MEYVPVCDWMLDQQDRHASPLNWSVCRKIQTRDGVWVSIASISLTWPEICAHRGGKIPAFYGREIFHFCENRIHDWNQSLLSAYHYFCSRICFYAISIHRSLLFHGTRVPSVTNPYAGFFPWSSRETWSVSTFFIYLHVFIVDISFLVPQVPYGDRISVYDFQRTLTATFWFIWNEGSRKWMFLSTKTRILVE